MRYTRHNDDIHKMDSLDISRRTIWNHQTYTHLRELIRRRRPAVMHCTNTFPLISPAAYYAARAEGVVIVQTLQNYRLLCAGGYLHRAGQICEDCIGKAVPWPAVAHGCYRDSRPASSVVATMLTLHRALKTWSKVVDLYVVATEFARRKFVQAGFSRKRIVVKPNFVHPSPEPGSGRGKYAVFVGRLSPEKGIDTLVAAWQTLKGELPLKILGEGPLDEKIRAFAGSDPRIEWLGLCPASEVQKVIGEAAFLVCPSLWYEGLPKTVVEAYSRGTPVLASNIGAMREVVDHCRTGLHFKAGNADDLVKKARRLIASPEKLCKMRTAAYRKFQQRYAAEPNYEKLMEIYHRALRRHKNMHKEATS